MRIISTPAGPRRSRTLAAVMLLMLFVSACSPPSSLDSPIAVRQDSGTVVVSLGCERTGIRGVEILGPSSVLWAIESDTDRGAPLTQFEVGTAPDGFVQVSEGEYEWTGGSIWVWSAVPGEDAWIPFLEFFSPDFLLESGRDGWSYPGGEQRELIERPWVEYQEWLRVADLGKWRCDS